MKEQDGKRGLEPAYVYSRRKNGEKPELYPVFPYRMYMVGRPDLDVGRETFERLNACAFVKTVQILWRVFIEADDMLHLWKKVWIGNLKIVFSPVGAQSMFQKDSMDGGTADRTTNGTRVLFEILLRITQ
jgi:hypothetical protein